MKNTSMSLYWWSDQDFPFINSLLFNKTFRQTDVTTMQQQQRKCNHYVHVKRVNQKVVLMENAQDDHLTA